MKSHFYHIQFNVKKENLPFYKEMMEFIGWSLIFEMDDMNGFKSETNGDLWFIASEAEQQNYDNLGGNHYSLRFDEQTNIDTAKDFLESKGIKMLFDTPRHRPEFAKPDETYYQIMFESPDKILFEFVYIGAHK